MVGPAACGGADRRARALEPPCFMLLPSVQASGVARVRLLSATQSNFGDQIMMLIEQTQVPDTGFPVAEFRDHLQLGSGFADDGLQDAVLIAQLQAAFAAVEGETGKVLLHKTFQYVVTAWREPNKQILPVAPVTVVQSLAITDLNEVATIVDESAYRIRGDDHCPSILSASWSLPTIPVGGTAEIIFDAGFADWAAVPADLRQAVLMLAAHFYENRSATVDRAIALPLAVATLLKRHKPLRLFGGGRR